MYKRRHTHTDGDHNTWAEQRHTREPCVAHRFLSVPLMNSKKLQPVFTALFSPTTIEVFTPPPHSTWTPHGVYMESTSFHIDSTWSPPFHMEYILAEIPLILGSPFHMDSMWIPYGMVMEYPNSTWNDGMSTWIPHGMMVWNASIPHRMRMEYIQSTWNEHGMHPVHME